MSELDYVSGGAVDDTSGALNLTIDGNGVQCMPEITTTAPMQYQSIASIGNDYTEMGVGFAGWGLAGGLAIAAGSVAAAPALVVTAVVVLAYWSSVLVVDSFGNTQHPQ
ncbi:hypothetical protein CR152_08720 [Massilia violaceinigra]|uniref:Uncharacterized protein n=2 Tax=Massilia violaceinigra TaxID=2045208 RepID=A0A2D2DHY1_9BURK|nr:hypothetical protein CR152_08720 [Massilia violaceinigra]